MGTPNLQKHNSSEAVAKTHKAIWGCFSSNSSGMKCSSTTSHLVYQSWEVKGWNEHSKMDEKNLVIMQKLPEFLWVGNPLQPLSTLLYVFVQVRQTSVTFQLSQLSIIEILELHLLLTEISRNLPKQLKRPFIWDQYMSNLQTGFSWTDGEKPRYQKNQFFFQLIKRMVGITKSNNQWGMAGSEKTLWLVGGGAG